MNYKIDLENAKSFFGTSPVVWSLIGLIFNGIFGTQLDIQFAGGAIVSIPFPASSTAPM